MAARRGERRVLKSDEEAGGGIESVWDGVGLGLAGVHEMAAALMSE